MLVKKGNEAMLALVSREGNMVTLPCSVELVIKLIRTKMSLAL